MVTAAPVSLAMNALIYDVGAHHGEDSAFYLKKGFRVVAIEANPWLAKALRERFADAMDTGQFTLVEGAVADQDGEVEFFVNGVSAWGTIREDWARRNLEMGAPSRKIRVPAVSFATVLERYGVPHYLKIDIEGADMVCVRALGKSSSRPAYVSLESSKTSWRELMAEFSTLAGLGYERFKVINQRRIEEQVEPVPAREGRHAGLRVQRDSTGLFGAELPGRWLTRDQALAKYAIIFLRYGLFGDSTLGRRIVRRLGPLSRLIPAWYDTHAALGTDAQETMPVASRQL